MATQSRHAEHREAQDRAAAAFAAELRNWSVPDRVVLIGKYVNPAFDVMQR
jgi:hypothetical protein